MPMLDEVRDCATRSVNVRLGDVCEVVSGSTPKTSVATYWDGAHPWVTPAELNADTIVVSDTVRHLSDEGAASAVLKPFPAGTVLLSSRAPIGKVAIAGRSMYCNQGFKNLICSDAISNYYLYYWLRSHTAFLNSLGRGATFKEISKSIVEQIQIPLPPLAEQKRIVAVLDRICELIAKRKEQLAKLDELVKSRFVEMFGDPLINPKGFRVVRLSQLICHANNGMTRRGKDSEGQIVLRIVELRDGFIDYCNPNRICVNDKERERYLLVENDFLFVRVNGNPDYVGRCAPFKDIGEPVFHNDHIIRVRFSEDVDPTYMSTILNGRYGKKEIRDKLKTSAGQYTINQDGIGAINVPLPPLALQREFAAFVAEVDKSEFAVRKSLEELQKLYRQQLQEAFG